MEFDLIFLFKNVLDAILKSSDNQERIIVLNV